MGEAAAINSAAPVGVYITRPEFSERMSALTSNVRQVENDVVNIKSKQDTQQETLNKILDVVQKQGSFKNSLIAGFSGLGGGIAAGTIYLLHWLTQ